MLRSEVVWLLLRVKRVWTFASIRCANSKRVPLLSRLLEALSEQTHLHLKVLD